jgi:hypothetical protein
LVLGVLLGVGVASSARNTDEVSSIVVSIVGILSMIGVSVNTLILREVGANSRIDSVLLIKVRGLLLRRVIFVDPSLANHPGIFVPLCQSLCNVAIATTSSKLNSLGSYSEKVSNSLLLLYCL